MKVLKLIRERFLQKPVFTIFEVKKYTSHASQLLNYLLKKREIVRITKGYYTFHKDVMVVGNAYAPYYYGLYEALSLYNLTDQETNPIVITPRKVRTGIRTFLGRNYVVKRIKREMFFGYTTLKYYDFYIYVSDYEKTLIDFFYFKEKLEGWELEELINVIDKEKLKEYLKRCPGWLVKRVKDTLGEL